ncbi:PEPxxWA-CTERM sorting domain-containing protein [Sandaracinobacter neustonicus]|nr:PEPxxWA-CTERM sorting domain-containing protein [Sandaracinobacter neustonicus]
MRFEKGIFLATVALWATSAGAYNVSVTPDYGHVLVIENTLDSLGTTPEVLYKSDSSGKGAGYAANVTTTGSSVFFSSSSISAGAGNGSGSLVGVTLDFSDLGAAQINSMTSTIFQSTFGFYMAPFGNNVPVCTGATLPTCLGATTGAVDFAAMIDGGSSVLPPGMAGSYFSFDVLVNGTTQYSIGGGLTLFDNGTNPPVLLSYSNINGVLGALDDLSTVLPGFQLLQNDGYGLIYGWDQSNFTVNFDTPITDSGSITYQITTSTFGDSLTGDNESSRSIIAFSCFADPVGRGSTRGSLIPLLSNLADPTCDDFRSEGDQKRDYVLKLGTIDENGNFGFTAPGGAIPEPDTWAMLIMGFGLVGLSMRRGRKPVESA